MNIIMPWHILIHIPLNFYVFDITRLRFLFLAEHSYFLIFPNGAEIEKNKKQNPMHCPSHLTIIDITFVLHCYLATHNIVNLLIIFT